MTALRITSTVAVFLRVQIAHFERKMRSWTEAICWDSRLCLETPSISCNFKISSVQKKILSPGARQTAQVFRPTRKFKGDVIQRKIKKWLLCKCASTIRNNGNKVDLSTILRHYTVEGLKRRHTSVFENFKVHNTSETAYQVKDFKKNINSKYK
ncbi:hypothetical protein TNIN_149631 [Trichonephila inaurata madagascariensis]|uniref:Uncharacterized protein n=1 Tax=Trichonephila inaurata madagascariensis TaxID=2747483 RepID=A0A8X6YD38_9ARAC|nr:hypothetical protein TNIN_149631 [Trichonephila inaurata madagascariensis]